MDAILLFPPVDTDGEATATLPDGRVVKVPNTIARNGKRVVQWIAQLYLGNQAALLRSVDLASAGMEYRYLPGEDS